MPPWDPLLTYKQLVFVQLGRVWGGQMKQEPHLQMRPLWLQDNAWNKRKREEDTLLFKLDLSLTPFRKT